jgi:hypothetical protein
MNEDSLFLFLVAYCAGCQSSIYSLCLPILYLQFFLIVPKHLVWPEIVGSRVAKSYIPPRFLDSIFSWIHQEYACLEPNAIQTISQWKATMCSLIIYMLFMTPVVLLIYIVKSGKGFVGDETSLTPPLSTEIPIPSQESDRSSLYNNWSWQLNN